jgi:predicted GIY-YIG superfamily endonuclease
MNCRLYILENQRGKHYIGITKLDLDKRLRKHNRGEVYSTKFDRPWKVLYFEKYSNYKEARGREKEMKSWHGGNSFKKLLHIAAGSSNGRTWDFESQYLGSTPSPAAMGRRKFGGVK